jgi:hypothetical protein
VADIIAELRPFAADITYLCHDFSRRVQNLICEVLILPDGERFRQTDAFIPSCFPLLFRAPIPCCSERSEESAFCISNQTAGSSPVKAGSEQQASRCASSGFVPLKLVIPSGVEGPGVRTLSRAVIPKARTA